MIEELYHIFEEAKKRVQERGVKLIDVRLPSEESRASRQMDGKQNTSHSSCRRTPSSASTQMAESTFALAVKTSFSI